VIEYHTVSIMVVLLYTPFSLPSSCPALSAACFFFVFIYKMK